MRALSPWAAGSLLFALAGCSTANPSGATASAAGATSGRDDGTSQGTTDSGARVFGAEPLGALVVETMPSLGSEPSVTEPGIAADPRVPARRTGQPVYRPPAFTPVRPTAPPPPPPPPHPAFPPPSNGSATQAPPEAAASGALGLPPTADLPPRDARSPR
jgi:hypothetical protein